MTQGYRGTDRSELREADRMIGQGSSVADVLQHLGGTDARCFRWRNQYGAMSPDEAKRLDVGNARLKKWLAEAEVDKAILSRWPRGNGRPG